MEQEIKAQAEAVKKPRVITEDVLGGKLKQYQQGLLEMKEQQRAYQDELDNLGVRIGRTEGAMLAIQELMQPTESQVAPPNGSQPPAPTPEPMPEPVAEQG